MLLPLANVVSLVFTYRFVLCSSCTNTVWGYNFWFSFLNDHVLLGHLCSHIWYAYVQKYCAKCLNCLPERNLRTLWQVYINIIVEMGWHHIPKHTSCNKEPPCEVPSLHSVIQRLPLVASDPYPYAVDFHSCLCYQIACGITSVALILAVRHWY